MTFLNSLQRSGLVAAVVFSSLSSCSEKAKETINLQGKYQTETSTELGISTGGIGCVIYQLDISLVNQLTAVESYYNDANCRGKNIGNIVTEGSFSIGNELAIAPGAREFNLTIQKISLIPIDPSWATVFGIDASGDCNIKDIPVGQAREVTGLKCGVFGKFPAKNQVYYASYVMTGDTLEFTKLPNGAKENVGTAEVPAPRNQVLSLKFRKK